VFNRLRSTKGRWHFLLPALILLAGLVVVVPRPAVAYTDTFYSYDNLHPNLYFARGGTINSDHAILGTLTAYLSFDGYRHRIVMTAGSGNNQLDDCVSNYGPSPDGYYGYSDGDSNSQLTLMNKTWGNTVVRGWVWFMDSKRCDGGSSTLRTELFIHSQGTSGWDDANYKSAGCVKINQVDRSWLASAYQMSWDKSNGRLSVTGNEA